MLNWNIRSPTLISAAIYSSLSLFGAIAFLAITILTGDYSWVARVGGAGWVFLLSMIILMPTVTTWVKRKLGRGS